MKESRLLQVIGNIDEKYILEMEDIVCSMHKVTTHKPIKKAWLIAAVVAIMVLLMGSTLLIPLVQPECPVMDLPLVQGSQIAQEDIRLSVSNVQPTSMDILCSIDSIKPGEQSIYILTQPPFTLEKKTEEGWLKLPVMHSDPQIDATKVMTEGYADWHVDWSATYGLLENGSYRYTATVLEGSQPVTIEFTIADTAAKELTQAVEKLLNADTYHIRYRTECRFGSFENVSDHDREIIEAENAVYTTEYLKQGEDLLVLLFRNDAPWGGMMIRDGMKYSLEFEGESKKNPVSGWSYWPDLDVNRLTEWVGSIRKGTAEFSPTGDLVRVLSVENTVYSGMDLDMTITEVWEVLPTEETVIRDRFEAQDVDIVPAFSWSEDSQKLSGLEISFKNTSYLPTYTATQALQRAKTECSVAYNKAAVYRDEDAKMWKVVFQVEYGYHGYQYVYLDDSGITRMIVSLGPKTGTFYVNNEP